MRLVTIRNYMATKSRKKNIDKNMRLPHFKIHLKKHNVYHILMGKV